MFKIFLNGKFTPVFFKAGKFVVVGLGPVWWTQAQLLECQKTGRLPVEGHGDCAVDNVRAVKAAEAKLGACHTREETRDAVFQGLSPRACRE